MLLGFGSPVALLSGFIFGKWVGTLVVVVSISIGALILYTITKFFFKDLIESKFPKKMFFLKLQNFTLVHFNIGLLRKKLFQYLSSL